MYCTSPQGVWILIFAISYFSALPSKVIFVFLSASDCHLFPLHCMLGNRCTAFSQTHFAVVFYARRIPYYFMWRHMCTCLRSQRCDWYRDTKSPVWLAFPASEPIRSYCSDQISLLLLSFLILCIRFESLHHS